MNDESCGRPKVGTIVEMRDRCLHWTTDANGRRIVAGSIYNRFILRSISVPVTRCFIQLGIGANTATVLMMFAGIAGIACCVPHLAWVTIAGAIGLALFDLLDAVDGEIARWNETSSTRGLFLEKATHLLVECPSLGIAGVHYHMMVQDSLYLVLAGVAMIAGAISRALRETLFRINAEAGTLGDAPEPPLQSRDVRRRHRFLDFCEFLKQTPLVGFPITKARVVHILTVGAIFASYQGIELPLIFLAWFYAAYCALRLTFEVPYYYGKRIIDVAHQKKVQDYHWPI